MLKIYITYDFRKRAYGGANQFLKALKDYFVLNGCYIDKAGAADVILMNSHSNVEEIIKIKSKYSNKLFIHRIDGPAKLYNKISDKRDDIAYLINEYIADATIFQSEWSKQKNYKMGLSTTNLKTTITNAPNINIFNKKDKLPFKSSSKIKIIANSWSFGMNKGFAVYKWLDENLDFNKYEMTFCGNSPIEFKNINHIEPLPSNELAKQLKQHDIYITASQNDPCSNSLIEALHCGLPVIALNSGGHTEIVNKGGLLFDKQEEIPELLKNIEQGYYNYTENIDVPNIENVAKNYLDFMTKCYNQSKKSNFTHKKLSLKQTFHLKYEILKYKIKSKLN